MDAAWEQVVGEVLGEVEDGPVARGLLRRRMKESGEMELLYASFVGEGDTQILRGLMRRLARKHQ